MRSDETLPDDDACYLALKAKDARFDGCFFTGVTSTGIYCRPVCRVRTPQARVWSIQDGSNILATQAARLLDTPDAFAAGDMALQKALGVQDCKNPTKEAQAASHAWQPWRSYAVIRAWASKEI